MVKLLELRKVKERFRFEMDVTTKRVLDSGWNLLGREYVAFEKAFAEYCDVRQQKQFVHRIRKGVERT